MDSMSAIVYSSQRNIRHSDTWNASHIMKANKKKNHAKGSLSFIKKKKYDLSTTTTNKKKKTWSLLWHSGRSSICIYQRWFYQFTIALS